MILARVTGTVVASARSDRMEQPTYLLVTPCAVDGKPDGTAIVALDSVGAGQGEIVLVSQGSSTRQIPETIDKPVDALVIGIVDIVEESGKDVYSK
ncbi:MAG: EutN/CcmL family microcompartment protein [Spirochaetales bacterium]|nr:EutN/CcmL family microcompartment protein [Spirochaetales bacterium]